MEKITIVGNIFGTSGFANHVKNLARALYDQGTYVVIECDRPPGWELQVTDQELLMLDREHTKDNDLLVIAQPTEWAAVKTIPHKRFFGFLVWEGDKVPSYFEKPVDEADIVFVPSTHVLEAINNTFETNTPIKIVPHGVDTKIFSDCKQPEEFTFVSNKGWAHGMDDRGGMQFVIKAFAEEFSIDDPVCLRLKINTTYCPPGWDFEEQKKQLGLAEPLPKILVSTDSVDYKSLAQFYEGHVFVSASMAEGFNIPVLEGFAAGMPAIVNDFGGHTDFVNEETGWLVSGERFIVDKFTDYEGVAWQKPDLKQLRRAMRYAFTHREEVAEKALLARKIAKKFSWTAAAKTLLSFL